MLHNEETCPVPEQLLGEMYRANSHGLDALVTTVPPLMRAMLALYCFRRAHLNSIGLAIAASCEEQDLIEAGGRAGQALYEMARERPLEQRSEPTGRKKITMASGQLRDMSRFRDEDPGTEAVAV
jgi:hypothetical protein